VDRREFITVGSGLMAIGGSFSSEPAAAASAAPHMSGEGIMADTMERKLAELLAKESIRDLTYRLAHAIDRRDWASMPAYFWPDAELEMEGGKALAPIFIARAKQAYEGARVGVTQHFIGNCLIVVTGRTAVAEIYHQAYHRVPLGDRDRDVLIGGRYIDSFEERNGEWRVSGRKVVFDWFREFADSGDWKTGVFGITQGSSVIATPVL